MAHFAEIDENNVVIRVFVIADSDTSDENGNEVEEIGRAFCAANWGGRWIQTSYSGKIRHRYCGPGYTYDEQRDVFLTPKPFDSWVLDETTFDWVPPFPAPQEDGMIFIWDEDTVSWTSKPIPQELLNQSASENQS